MREKKGDVRRLLKGYLAGWPLELQQWRNEVWVADENQGVIGVRWCLKPHERTGLPERVLRGF